MSSLSHNGLTAKGLTRRQMRDCLERLLTRKLGMDGNEVAVIRPIGHDFIRLDHSTLLGFLSAVQLVECLADHHPQLLEFILAQVNLDRPGVSLMVDHEGAEWLTLDDGCVDLPPDDFCHEFSSMLVREAARAAQAAQGGAA